MSSVILQARGWTGDPQWKPSITLATGEEYGIANRVLV